MPTNPTIGYRNLAEVLYLLQIFEERLTKNETKPLKLRDENMLKRTIKYLERKTNND